MEYVGCFAYKVSASCVDLRDWRLVMSGTVTVFFALSFGSLFAGDEKYAAKTTINGLTGQQPDYVMLGTFCCR